MFKHAIATFALTLAALGAAVAQVAAQPPADYTVFVDPPTGFVFLKLPAGWKFVGKVDETALARLPDGVVTSLLPAEQDEPRLAGREAARLR